MPHFQGAFSAAAIPINFHSTKIIDVYPRLHQDRNLTYPQIQAADATANVAIIL